jgi:Immunity protein 26
MKKRPYREGSIFAIPLRSGGFAVGVVARKSAHHGGLLGYFFGPKFSSVPDSGDIGVLHPDMALRVLKFGDLSLMNHEWPVIGDITNWNRKEWPLPDFVRKDDISRKAWRVRYSEDDVCQYISEHPESFDSPLERDSMFGAGAVELLLTRLLT